MEDPILPRFQALLSCIRGIGNEKPSIREENMHKMPNESQFVINALQTRQQDPLILEISNSLKDFLELCVRSQRWEDRFAGVFSLDFLASKGLLNEFSLEHFDDFFVLLEEKEPRLRTQTALFFGNLCRNLGFSRVFPLISVKIIPKCVEEAEKPIGRVLEANLTVLNLAFGSLGVDMFLEKQAFLEIVKEIIGRTIAHQMKHIRVLALEILDKLLQNQPLNDIIEEEGFFEMLVLWLRDALADCHTEPRFQGTKTAGFFLLRLKSAGYAKLEPLERKLLPRICFNRLYPAESFSKESLNIWRKYVENNGKQMLGSLIAESIVYDLEEIKEKNWEVRETACKAFHELISKAIINDKEATETLMKRREEVLQSLLAATSDQYQTVRESAYLAILMGVNEVFKGLEKVVYEGVCENYGESYPEIRRLMAEILGTICESDKGGEMAAKMLEIFEKAMKEEEESHKKEEIQCEEMKEGTCSHHEHQKAHKHIHKGDILDLYVSFLKEISRIYSKTKPELIERVLAMFLSFGNVLKKEKLALVRENIWKCLGESFVNAGKPIAKKNADSYLEFAFEELENKENKEKEAVKGFVKRIAGFIGPNIVKGRIENLNGGKWVKLYSEI